MECFFALSKPVSNPCYKLLRYTLYTCPNLQYNLCSKCCGMNCFGTYFTHANLWCNPCSFFFAGGCLGWSRAERPSVSWAMVKRHYSQKHQLGKMSIFDNCTKTCERPMKTKISNKTTKGCKTIHAEGRKNFSKEGSGDVIQTNPMPEEATKGKRWLWWNRKVAPMPEPVCESRQVEDINIMWLIGL